MDRLYVAMYHYVRDLANSRYPEIKGMNIQDFKTQLEFMKSNFNIVRMEDVMDAADGKKELPENALLLTFDDGYIDNYTYVFPILEKMNLQGSFFITGKTFVEHKLLDVNKIHFTLASASAETMLPILLERMNYYRGTEFDFPSNEELWNEFAVQTRLDTKEVIFLKRMLQTALPERLRNIITTEMFQQFVGIDEDKFARELYMTEDQMETLKRHGMFIGVHGYDHYWMERLTEDEAKQDIDKALAAMAPYIDPNKWVINYPYGSANEAILKYVESKGASLGFSTQYTVADLKRDNRFYLPRLDCIDFPPRGDFYLTR